MNRLWQSFSLAFLLLLTGLSLYSPNASADDKPTVKIMCGNVGKELSFCQAGAKAWAEKTGNNVEVLAAVNGSNERLALYLQFFATKSSDVDVFQVDVTWPGLLEPHLEDLSTYFPVEERNEFLPVLVQNNTVNNKFLAIPWFADTGVLYYRKDLLDKYNKPVPQTWGELFETANFIQEAERQAGNKNIWGYVFQGKAYEGLTVNSLEWIKSAGTDFFDHDGNVTVNNSHAKDIMRLLTANMGKTIPQGVLNYAEEDARGAFQSGNAVFMRNWPYAYRLAEAPDSAIKGKIGLALLPKAGPQGNNAGALGGWQLAVSKYSKNKALAADLIKYLTGLEEQKRRAVEGGYTPTRMALHKDKEVALNSTYLSFFSDKMDHMATRPSSISGRKYSQVTSGIWQTFHRMLSQGANADVDKDMDGLAKKLKMLVPAKRA